MGSRWHPSWEEPLTPIRNHGRLCNLDWMDPLEGSLGWAPWLGPLKRVPSEEGPVERVLSEEGPVERVLSTEGLVGRVPSDEGSALRGPFES